MTQRAGRAAALLVSAMLASAAGASWYWPFGGDDDGQGEKSPPRLSELMEPASLLIDEATDLAEDGKREEAIEKYREALAALDEVEASNRERADKPEFATLRNKRAYVNATIDSLLLAQAQSNARAVAVSDTTALEKKLADERAGKEKDAQSPSAAAQSPKTSPVAEAQSPKTSPVAAAQSPKTSPVAAAQSPKTSPVAAAQSPKTSPVAAAQSPKTSPVAAAQSPKTSPVAAAQEQKQSPNAAAQEQKQEPAPAEATAATAQGGSARRQAPLSLRAQAMADIAAGDCDAAALVVAEMLAATPDGVAALNLKAALETARGDFRAAEAALDRAISVHPRSHFAYYNMARMIMQSRPSDRGAARRYYDTGRSVGGPRDEKLEETLK